MTERASTRSIRPSTVVTRSARSRSAMTAVLDPAAFEALQRPQRRPARRSSRPTRSSAAILADLEKRSEVQVLMVQGPPEEAKRLAEKFPGFDLVVATSDFDDPDERPRRSTAARPCWSTSARRGSTSASSASSRARRRAPSSAPGARRPGLPPGRADAEADRRDVSAEAQRRRAWSRTSPGAPTAGPPGATYVGAEACQACHPKTFEKWTTTKHAKAFEP